MAQHVFIGGRCTHCGVQELDVFEDEPGYPDYNCPDYPGRKTVWSFGPDGSDEVDG